MFVRCFFNLLFLKTLYFCNFLSIIMTLKLPISNMFSLRRFRQIPLLNYGFSFVNLAKSSELCTEKKK